MHATAFKTKVTAGFLVAFVCLNAGGADCVAYCQTAQKGTASSQVHHPSNNQRHHCDTTEQKQSDEYAISAEGSRVDCCPMGVSLIAAPIEQKIFSSEAAAPVVSIKTEPQLPTSLQKPGQSFIPAYRGPPLDRRIERIKYRLLRI